MHWGGRLWTLFEAGQPYRLNPATLETEASGMGMRFASKPWLCVVTVPALIPIHALALLPQSTLADHPLLLPMQGLETLHGQVQPGLPFDLGSQAANEGFSGMVRGIHTRLGSAAHMPPELFNAGEGVLGC